VICFRALSTTVRLSIDDDFVYRDLVERLVSTYEPTDSGELVYELSSDVQRNGKRLPCNGPADVVHGFEGDLYHQVIQRAAPGWVLHAAAVQVDRGALVLCGPSGAGKTTLTLALAARGYRILTEEAVWIDHSGSVRGLARPFHIADDKQDQNTPAGWTRYWYPGRATGSTQSQVAVPPPDVYRLGVVQLAAIVRLGHGPDWPVYLRESPVGLAMERLWARSFRHDDSGLAAATSVLRHYPTYELSRTTESEALSLLDPLLK